MPYALLPPPALVQHARSAAYDIVLLAHVLAALASLLVVAVAGAYALALRRPGPRSDPVLRYYRPGVNWAGRVLFAVPVLGAALVAMSRGDWSFSDGWVVAGLALWLVAALAAEAGLWPVERRLQEAVARHLPPDELAPARRRATASASAIGVLLVAAAVVMVAKP